MFLNKDLVLLIIFKLNLKNLIFDIIITIMKTTIKYKYIVVEEIGIYEDLYRYLSTSRTNE